MFGYVKINKMDLTFREYEHYRGYYCGLCKYLKDNHGEISRLSLNYDIKDNKWNNRICSKYECTFNIL